MDILREEHRAIDEMIDLLDLSIKKAKEPSGLPLEVMSKELDFCKNFVTKCHEAKEEEILAPELHKRGYPIDRGPVLEMFEDHKKGRSILRRFLATERHTRDVERSKMFSELGAAYSLFLYEHMIGEEEHLFKKADLAIDAPSQEKLGTESERIEERIGAGAHEKYLGYIAEIRSALR